jgi:uncharacterized protein (TIRG00374 family)
VTVPADPPPHQGLRSYWTVWRVARFAVGVALAGLAVYIVAGRTDELSGASRYLDDLHWYWLAVAAVAEGASVLAYARLQGRLLLAGRVQVPMVPLSAITLAGNAIQNSLPGGPVFSTVYAFRQFRRRGADDILAGWVLVGATALLMITLVALAAVGLAAATETGTALDLAGVIAAMVLLAIVVVIAWTRRAGVAHGLVVLARAARKVVRRPRRDPAAAIEGALARMDAVLPSRPEWAVSILLAMANWVLDIVCLVTAFFAVGAPVPWRGLLLAYGAAQLAVNLPITPGGLGVVEGSLTIALVAYGGSEASTVAAVLVYRLLSFWVLLPIGYLSWAGLAWVQRRGGRAAAAPAALHREQAA